jgi:hypothetical protein
MVRSRPTSKGLDSPKRSKGVGLVVLGTLGTAWAGYAWLSPPPPVSVRQDQYASMEECLQDWGADADTCTPGQALDSASSSGSGAGMRTVFGPRYYWHRTSSGSGYPVEIRSDGQTRKLSNSRVSEAGSSRSTAVSRSSHSVSRGGFGSSSIRSSGG